MPYPSTPEGRAKQQEARHRWYMNKKADPAWREKRKTYIYAYRADPTKREARLSKRRRCMQESEVEKYLVQQVELRNGLCEKFNPPPKGRPDRMVTWPGVVHFVELKTIGGQLASWQERDHARRRALKCQVFVLWTKKQVDEYIERFAP